MKNIQKTAGEELKKYLSKTYPDINFEISDSGKDGKRTIVFELLNDERPRNEEAFSIVAIPSLNKKKGRYVKI